MDFGSEKTISVIPESPTLYFQNIGLPSLSMDIFGMDMRDENILQFQKHGLNFELIKLTPTEGTIKRINGNLKNWDFLFLSYGNAS
jgi:hypothetical protein